MLAIETEAALRQHLRSRKLQLKALSASDVLSLATEFWTSTTIDAIGEAFGDGLIAYFEFLDRKGTAFEFGINRIMREPMADDAPYQAWLPASVLHFSICFRPTLETFQIKSSVATHSCWSKTEASDFVKDVAASPLFQHCASQPQKSCSIRLYQARAPWGDPNHPTQGYSWAVG